MKVIDTDLLIGFVRNDKDAVNTLSDLLEGDVSTTVVNAQEFLQGTPKNRLDESIEFLREFELFNYGWDEMVETVELTRDLFDSGQPIGLKDHMIAGICLTHDATLVTRNTRHFSQIEDLKVEEW